MSHTPTPWGDCRECETGHESQCTTVAVAKLTRQRDTLLSVVKELEESAGYWSEYDVPLGIVDRLKQAIKDVE